MFSSFAFGVTHGRTAPPRLLGTNGKTATIRRFALPLWLVTPSQERESLMAGLRHHICWVQMGRLCRLYSTHCRLVGGCRKWAGLRFAPTVSPASHSCALLAAEIVMTLRPLQFACDSVLLASPLISSHLVGCSAFANEPKPTRLLCSLLGVESGSFSRCL